MIYKQCLKCCAPSILVMERRFKLPAWNGQNVLLSIIRAVSNFSHWESAHTTLSHSSSCFCSGKKRLLGSSDKTRRVRRAETSVLTDANRMLLLDIAEVVNSIIYSYCWSFLCHFFFFPLLRDCFVFNFTTGGQRTSDENEWCFANSHHHPSRDLSRVTKRSKVVIKWLIPSPC